MGAATARMFAEAGANLVLAARGKKNLDAMAEELRGKTRVEIFAMDVTDANACADLLKKADYEFGRIDILVNNAGYHKRGSFESVSAEDLGAMIDVNLKAPIVLSRLALPFLRDHGGGVIVNVASLAGRTPLPGSVAYSASKFGLRTFALALADELSDDSVKLAIVSPGPIDTLSIMDQLDNVSELTLSQPMSTAEDVAQAILDICGNNVREQCMPALSGYLMTMTYVMPWLRRIVRPFFQKKGMRVKAKLKAAAKAVANENA